MADSPSEKRNATRFPEEGVSPFAWNAGQTTAGARTVLHLTKSLTEVMSNADALQLEINPVGRGYFAVSEEEQAQSLLVTYWQLRSALHELIDDMLRQQVFVEPCRPDDPPGPDVAELDRRFLIAFAAALLLVDAGRFLRKLVARRAVVRRLLNLPVPHFHIQAGTYDAVQRSLLNVRHGWRLLQAKRYLQLHRARIEMSAREGLESGLFLQVMELCDQRLVAIQVSRIRFLRMTIRTTIDRLARGLGRRFYARTVYNLQKFGSEIVADVYVLPGHQPSLPTDVQSAIAARLEPGDVLAVRKEHALTNYFLPGFWPHVALYLGTPEELKQQGLWSRLESHLPSTDTSLLQGPLVLEAMKDGVLVRPLASPFACDSIVVLRPTLDSADRTRALRRALQHAGKAYDFDFDFSRSNRLVCTEVVYRAFDGIGAVQFTLKRRAGRPTLSGSDLLKLGRLRDGFRPVLAVEVNSQEIVEGYEVDAIMDSHQESADATHWGSSADP